MSLHGIVSGLKDADVGFVVIGGVAATAHGSARITNVVEICYDPAPDNRARLARVLAGWHAYMRGVEPGLPFFMDERTLRDVPVLTLVTDEGDLDVMDRVPGVGGFGAVRAASQEVALDGVPVLVLGLDALIAAKRATARRKDQEALLELEALRELKRKGR